ncbi:MAG: ABC transporter ATP-binding protein [Proteobacteria bacterium]|nr:ABC transporter ATP-binding protein [Pseudomonadota bacterium]
MTSSDSPFAPSTRGDKQWPSRVPGEPTVVVDQCSKWYGQVLGISEVTWQAGAGIVGLLGPNGAGKSTLIKLMAGLLAPSRGTLTVFGQSPHRSAATRARIGYCPEHEGMYDELTALEMITVMAELSGIDRRSARAAAAAALAEMGLDHAKHRRLKGFSKGMRQRTKLAQCLVHDPDVLLLDEPLTGVDPVARAEITEHVRRIASAGKTVILSSHVLHEIEALTETIVVIHRGQVLAEGNMYRIRELIDQHPHCIRVECDRSRDLAADLAAAEHVRRLGFEDGAVIVETSDPDACYDLIADLVVARGIEVGSLTSPDNNLGAVFDYLTRSST